MIALACFLLIIFASTTFFIALRKVIAHLRIRTRHILLAAAPLFLVLFLPSGVLNNLLTLRDMLSVNNVNFDQALRDLGIPPDEYVPPNLLNATQGKNIIAISIESLEKAFLNPAFDRSAPHLQDLARNWTCRDMLPTPGCTWTAGSLYCSQVGIPAFFNGHPNELFQQTEQTRLTGLGHILNKAGYRTLYLMGRPGYGGSEDILKSWGFTTVSEKNCAGRYPASRIGLNDYDVFREAKIQIRRKARNKDKPFALFMSTLNTHFPDGIYDKRMERFIGTEKKGLMFSIAAVDYLINDLLQFLADEGLLDNTAVFLFPDHELMGTTGPLVHRLNEHERKLYILTNVPEDDLPHKSPISQIDIPRFIVQGAGIHSNARFLTDFITGPDIRPYLDSNKVRITALNTASLRRKNYKSGFHFQIHSDRFVLTRGKTDEDTGGETLTFPLPKNADKTVDVTFDENMIPVQHELVPNSRAFKPSRADTERKRIHLLVRTDGTAVSSSYLGDKKNIGIRKDSAADRYTESEIRNLLTTLHATPLPRTDASNETKGDTGRTSLFEYADDPERFIAHAGGMIEGYIYTNSREALDLSCRNGLKLFELDIRKTAGGHYVAVHDWKSWAQSVEYHGPLPPTKTEFLRRKIHGRFTPLDMDGINKWFAAHPDAVLVTDKINEPKEFSRLFMDKNRLMMELFTWDAVREGMASGIRTPMPTGALLDKIKGDKIAFLSRTGVTAAACSRTLIESRKDLLHDLKKAGIRTYAFHINYAEVDEKRFVCEERDFFHGMYVDQWTIPADVHCPE